MDLASPLTQTFLIILGIFVTAIVGVSAFLRLSGLGQR